ncbi:uncharacterized protein LOC134224615 isoform X1 [Armigeres subalbatus]|uniref:uncharacterized protein LOC134224615 isoform X1 n=1 Tax=Armigeres subalbatus TaxID=124917 RepID=UPI002ED30FDD
MDEYDSVEYLEELTAEAAVFIDEPTIQAGADSGDRARDENVDMSKVRYDIEFFESDEEGGPSTFCFNGIYLERLYKSQLRPKEIAQASVHGNSPEEILRCIWERARKVIRRQVIFEDDIPHWSEEHDPEFEDIAKFILLQDTVRKKIYGTLQITPRLLTSWRNKSIKIFIHTYSTSIETSGQYQLVTRKLIAPQNPDRSGAHSTRDDSALATELRDSHPHLEGHFSSWLLWANQINSSPAHSRDRLIQDSSPPLELSKYFRWAGVSEAARLQTAHRSMLAAQTNNDAWNRDMADLTNDLNKALNILQGMKQKMESMSTRGSITAELFTAMESVTRPEESNLSREIADRVTECEDVDHLQ